MFSSLSVTYNNFTCVCVVDPIKHVFHLETLRYYWKAFTFFHFCYLILSKQTSFSTCLYSWKNFVSFRISKRVILNTIHILILYCTNYNTVWVVLYQTILGLGMLISSFIFVSYTLTHLSVTRYYAFPYQQVEKNILVSKSF